MEYLGLYKKDILILEYCQNEKYYYWTWHGTITRKTFKTNSMLNAFAKTIKDLGTEDIVWSIDGEHWLKMYQENKDVYENTLMEHAIGLSKKYKLDNLVNAYGEKLKRYCAWRYHFYSEPIGKDYKTIQKLVKFGFMEEYQPNYFKCTWEGLYWLECKYDLEIYEDD